MRPHNPASESVYRRTDGPQDLHASRRRRAPYESATPGRLGGHRRAKAYGTLDCRTALRAIAKGGYVANRVFFVDEQTAAAAGYRPCAVCLPAEYRAWRASKDC